MNKGLLREETWEWYVIKAAERSRMTWRPSKELIVGEKEVRCGTRVVRERSALGEGVRGSLFKNRQSQDRLVFILAIYVFSVFVLEYGRCCSVRITRDLKSKCTMGFVNKPRESKRLGELVFRKGFGFLCSFTREALEKIPLFLYYL